MNRNKKPVLAATNTRAVYIRQSHDTRPRNYFQCPRCRLTGNPDVFSDLDWPERLLEAITRNPGLGIEGDLSSMNYQEARSLYNWIIRQRGEHGQV
ncbi:MAG: hypothetical protein VW907_05245 [Opitutae bacterium]